MRTNRRLMLIAASAGALIVGAGCATTPTPAPATETIGRTAGLATISRLIDESGLADTLRGAGPFTLFAPSDDAFKALPAKTLEELSRDKERLKAVLTYHAVAGKLTAAEVKPGNLKTINGANVAVSKAGTFVTFDEAVVIRADIGATNGVVHVIDKVILPPAPRR